MPSKVTLFDAKCKAVYDLGTGPYNLVWWNPFGRFLAVAGFGNLPGGCQTFLRNKCCIKKTQSVTDAVSPVVSISPFSLAKLTTQFSWCMACNQKV